MIVSFDFDGTLECEEVQELVKITQDAGHKAVVLTTRYDDKDNFDLYQITERLGIKEINFTNFEWKYTVIDDLGIDLHIDDYSFEVERITTECKAEAVLFRYKGWKKKFLSLILS